MIDFIKVLLYAILGIIALCLIIPLLCLIIGWSTPYFTQFLILLGNNPIIFWILVIAGIVGLFKFISNLS